MRLALIAVLCTAAVLLGGPSSAHEGHDHGDTKPVLTTTAAPRGEAASDNFELVIVARDGALDIYLDAFATNEPVEGAVIEVETPTGPAQAQARPGAPYTLPAPWLQPEGVDLVVTVTSQGVTDILPVSVPAATPAPGATSTSKDSTISVWPIAASAGAAALLAVIALAFSNRRSAALSLMFALLMVAPALAHEGHDHGPPQAAPAAPAGDLAQRLPDGSIFVPKPVQRIFGLRTTLVQGGEHRRASELPGRIIPDPGASGYLQSAIGGRLSPPPGGFPRLGTPVKEGDVLAYVTPPLQAIDVSDMRQRQGELDQQIVIVERRLVRAEQLAPSGAIARSQLEDIRSELSGLRERRAMLDRSRRDPEALVAPVSGVVADGSAVAGQIAQPNAVIFHIIDPGKLWVEALSFEIIPEAQEASAQTASGRTIKLAHRGSGFADRSQSIPVHFAIEDDTSGLRAGQFVTVLARSDDARKGIALPRSALVRAASGQDVVFEHVGAERFVRRMVRTAPLDGANVLVLTGLEDGRRIVTQGAELLDHVR